MLQMAVHARRAVAVPSDLQIGLDNRFSSTGSQEITPCLGHNLRVVRLICSSTFTLMEMNEGFSDGQSVDEKEN